MEHENEKVRKRRKRSMVLELFKDFNANSTLHGLKYFTEDEISLIERLFWMITFVLSLGLCCMLIYSVWIKWRDSPVIVSFSERMIPVWQVPFPALTICPSAKTKLFVYNFTENVQNFDNGSLEKSNDSLRFREKLANIALVCWHDLGAPFTDRDICDHTSIHDVIEAAPEVKDVFKKCSWKGVEENCSDMFEKVLTFYGVCYNFNGLPPSDIYDEESIQKEYQYMHTKKAIRGWSQETGYELRMDRTFYPRRGDQSSSLPDMEIELLETVQMQDKLCIGTKRGFKIILHHPGDLARAKPYFHIQGGQEAALFISLNMMTTSDELRSYPLHIRQCYFSSERKLRFFKEYTQKNCEMECTSNYTYSECSCVWFNMPHNDSRQICCHDKRACTYEADEIEASHEMQLALQAVAGNASDEGCSCLPACDTVIYEGDIFKSPHTETVMRKFHRNSSDFEDDEMELEYEIAKLEVNYKSPHFASLRRSELFGLTDFMANCGGLLGLFLGFSFLSLVEILYYSTLRLYCIIQRERVKNKRVNPV